MPHVLTLADQRSHHHPADTDPAWTGAQQKLRRRAERIAARKPAPARGKTDATYPESLQSMQHQLRVQEIELEMQAHALLRMRFALGVEKQRYAALCAGGGSMARGAEVVEQVESGFNRLAYYDPLTSLPNRGLLQDRLAQALATSARSGLYGAVFFINVDNFRALNSAEGHDAGDLLLVGLAARLRGLVRDCDTVARQWGDEFLILVEDLSDDSTTATHYARLLGERMQATMAVPVNLNRHEYQCSISVGATLFHQRDTVETVFKHAALALQQAKKSGRNTVCFFESVMQSVQDQRSAMSAELEKALLWQQFRVYYQPQVDSNKRVVGVEALVRWQHPLRGLVPPAEFIPLAEQTNLIVLLGLWVLKSACEQLNKWEGDPFTHELQVAVNVSARQFQQDDFVAQVKGALQDSGANPKRLKLELTEGLVLENIDDVISKMNQIKQLGVSFSMDDFGTGYSSLSYLAHLPIDQLKIDKSFVQNIPGKSSDETIARTIISMGQGLGMNVIAEGVETEAQRAFLAQHGCHAYQGYLFSRPLPVAALEAYLRQH